LLVLEPPDEPGSEPVRSVLQEEAVVSSRTPTVARSWLFTLFSGAKGFDHAARVRGGGLVQRVQSALN
jgi:hypothetical protein